VADSRGPALELPGPGLAAELVRGLAQPLRVLDIGSRGQVYPVLLPVAPATEIVGFEPDRDECARLNRQLPGQRWRSAVVLPYAVTGRSGPRTLHLTRRPDLSSLLRPRCPVPGTDWEVVERRRVMGRSLADLRCAGELTGRWDFLKVDVQGLEHEVLAGLPDDLYADLAGLEVECRLGHHYEGQHGMLDVAADVMRHGFELFALAPVFAGGSRVDETQPWPRSRRPLSHGDLLLLRDPRWPDGTADDRERLRRAGVLTLLYGLHGFWVAALELAGRHLPGQARRLRAVLAGDGGWRWRWRLLALSVAAMVDPRPAKRFRLARHAVTVDAEGLYWRLSAPKL
jgi:FkbM family methyltransferase